MPMLQPELPDAPDERAGAGVGLATGLSPGPDNRVVLVADSRRIALVSYAGADRLAEIEIEPLRAVQLAGELIDAAMRRLSADRQAGEGCGRGGDRRGGNRTARNLAIREYAELLGSDLSLEGKAKTIIAKHARYSPMPGDASRGGERQVLARIAATELPVPGPRQLRRILGT
jgi:hypothetical protein